MTIVFRLLLITVITLYMIQKQVTKMTRIHHYPSNDLCAVKNDLKLSARVHHIVLLLLNNSREKLTKKQSCLIILRN